MIIRLKPVTFGLSRSVRAVVTTHQDITFQFIVWCAFSKDLTSVVNLREKNRIFFPIFLKLSRIVSEINRLIVCVTSEYFVANEFPALVTAYQF